MTREEAIKEFVGYRTYDIQPSVEATKMAIEALELIPDNATNGDVIKALFPKLECDYWCPRFADDWWNAPYEAIEYYKECEQLADWLKELKNARETLKAMYSREGVM